MSGRTLARHLISSSVLLACLAAASCNDEPAGGGLWQEAILVDPPAKGALFSVAFSGSRGLAAGVGLSGSSATVYTPYLVARRSDDAWARPAAPALPAASLLSAVGFAPTGEELIAGAGHVDATGFVLDTRNGSSHTFPGFAGVVFASGPEVVRLAGSAADNNVVLKSTGPGLWLPEALPFSGRNDRGITDMSAANGVFFACGFDDGGEGTPASPNSVLFRNGGSGWVRLDVPCGACWNREFKAVAATASGGVFLGGAVTDFAAGAPDPYQAFLLLRSASGNWSEIVLPDAGALDTVNDILLASDGSIYLACGVTDGFIVRSPVAGPAEREAEFRVARIQALAEAPDGSIWAAGAVGAAAEARRPALWRRQP